VPIRNPKAKALYAEITNNFGTLAFCRRWIEDKFPRHTATLKQLVDLGLIDAYPPLDDVPGCHTAQYEHTIFLHPSRKEVISKGDDF
jgi:methionyl aminopeptidase